MSLATRKRRDGTHYAFELIDGATIKPLIGADGRAPLPPSPAYQQVIKGLPTVNYTRDELLYLPRNPRVHKFYGYSPVEQILLTVNIALRRGVSQLQYFTDGTIPAAFATLPDKWTAEQIRNFQDYWDMAVAIQQSVHRQVLWGPGGTKMTPMREAPLQDAFDEWLARIIAFAFSLPPTPFVKQASRATPEQQQETALQEGLAPLKLWVKELMDKLIQRCLGYPHLEFRWRIHQPVDAAARAEVLTEYQRNGVYSVNEVRVKLGDKPIDTEWAKAHVVHTAEGGQVLTGSSAATRQEGKNDRGIS